MTAPKTLAEAREAMPPLFTVYDRPRDYPACIVVRTWYGEFPDPTPRLFADVGDARAWIASQGGCFQIPRFANDDSKILESWL